MSTTTQAGDTPLVLALTKIPDPLRVDPPLFRGYCCTWVDNDGASISVIAPTAEKAASFYEFLSGRTADMSMVQDVVLGGAQRSHRLGK